MQVSHWLPGLMSLMLACAVSAQQVWVVDALNRPGAHFADIQSAVNAAAPGDVVRVRDARPAVSGYAGATITRGITLVGDPRAYLYNAITIQAVPPGEQCAVAEIDIDGWTGTCITVSGCAGQVHLESVATQNVFFTTTAGLTVVSCAHVTLTHCYVLGLRGMTCYSSTVAVSDSTIEGRGYYEALGGPGIIASSSRVTLASTPVFGAWTNSCCVTVRPPQPGISATQSTLILTGSRTRIAGGGVSAQPCSCNTPEVGLDADVATIVFVGNTQPFTSRGGTLIPQPVPSLSPARNAATLTWTLEGPANAMFATWLALPDGPTLYPFGDLWLDLARPHAILDAGVLGTSARTHQRSIPGGLPPGISFACQSALLDAGTTRLSTPAFTLLY